jgi:hypothetical protein
MADHPISQPSLSNRTTSGAPAASLTEDAILQAIENIVSKKLGELGAYKSIPSHNYIKPYPAWHDDVPFPMGYHQPKFKEFDGTGCPHEHIAHICQLVEIQQQAIPCYCDNLCKH